MTAASVDVAIVGGGISGLGAARALAAQGASVVVLEARDRVGGRTWSEQRHGAWFDRGGQWRGSNQPRMAALCEALGLRLFPTHHQGRKVLWLGDRISSYAGALPSMAPHKLVLLHVLLRSADVLARRVSAEAPWTARLAALADAVTVEAWRRLTPMGSDVRGVMDAAVRTVFGAEAGELSMLWFLAYLRAGGGMRSLVEIENGAQEQRFVDGAQAVSLGMAAALGDRVVLRAPVRAVVQDAQGVSLATDAGTWRSRYAIVAIPPSLAGRIRWDPGMPPDRDNLTARFPMGATIKFHALYERPFWREAGYSGELVCDRGPVAVAFDNTSHDGRVPALLGFGVGDAARAWGRRDPAERRAAVLDVFARCFGSAAKQPVDWLEQDWSTEAWSGGCPVGNPSPGTLVMLGPALRTPVGRVHWAGTETATAWTGYMEGALQAAERAVAEVSARL
ncbi:MAG: FAD-dependent oxidoreductase [bacterium]|nr:FAD-dependent oxidoreductase [bacterium]